MRFDIRDKQKQHFLKNVDRLERIYQKVFKRESVKHMRLGHVLSHIEKKGVGEVLAITYLVVSILYFLWDIFKKK